MVDESLYPLEFARFRETFIQMRVDNTVSQGGDGDAVRAELNVAFDSGWRPPQQFEMWLKGRKHLPLTKVVQINTQNGNFWVPLHVNEGDFRITKEEAENLAFNNGYRFN